MYLTIFTIVSFVMPLVSIEQDKDQTTNSVIFEQNHAPCCSSQTKIIYTKAPTPWVKVFNN